MGDVGGMSVNPKRLNLDGAISSNDETISVKASARRTATAVTTTTSQDILQNIVTDEDDKHLEDDDGIQVDSVPYLNAQFDKWLSDMRHPSKQSIRTNIRRFIENFNQHPNIEEAEEVKLVRDFIASTHYMFQELVWLPSAASPADKERDKECLERYIMSKIYDKCDAQSDLEFSKVAKSLSYLTPTHLEVPDAVASDPRLNIARIQLNRMREYKSPREKLSCIMNCCRCICTVITDHNTEGIPCGAGVYRVTCLCHLLDDFLPMLVYVILGSDIEGLVSSIEFIRRYRDPDQLIGESDYYLVQFTSAITFINNMTHEHLAIDPVEFNRRRELSGLSPPVTSQTSTVPTEIGGRTLKFFNITNVNDVRVGDLQLLLDEYQVLLIEVEKLRKQMADSKSMSNKRGSFSLWRFRKT